MLCLIRDQSLYAMPVALEMSSIFKYFENEIRYTKLLIIQSWLSRNNVVVLEDAAISTPF